MTDQELLNNYYPNWENEDTDVLLAWLEAWHQNDDDPIRESANVFQALDYGYDGPDVSCNDTVCQSYPIPIAITNTTATISWQRSWQVCDNHEDDTSSVTYPQANLQLNTNYNPATPEIGWENLFTKTCDEQTYFGSYEILYCKVIIDELNPGTTYHYRLVYDDDLYNSWVCNTSAQEFTTTTDGVYNYYSTARVILGGNISVQSGQPSNGGVAVSTSQHTQATFAVESINAMRLRIESVNSLNGVTDDYSMGGVVLGSRSTLEFIAVPHHERIVTVPAESVAADIPVFNLMIAMYVNQDYSVQADRIVTKDIHNNTIAHEVRSFEDNKLIIAVKTSLSSTEDTQIRIRY